MKRGVRIAIELLGPPAWGTALMAAWMVPTMLAETAHPRPWWEDARQGAAVLFLVLVFAYVFAGLQSVVYTVVLEWRFSRGLDPRSWRAVGWSTGLGFLSGAAIIVVLGRGAGDVLAWLIWGGLGATVGFLNGALIRWLSRRDVMPPAPAGDPEK